ncbi:Oligopeptide transport system permease protein OppB [Paenibacillus sp. CECT 9249]|uniref:ABC transporter permease n=1 Tax=Paenibacillus sp. CECT 9249 TaxID=2845385 RepID=UPI001E2D7E24|nr:ABC transporter permease [Paenibacillus sp. CECT 9249]CAH0119574.1 Oligopeptide transport system permease protein OppB [Paenibacillus sp. CECT 9249]
MVRYISSKFIYMLVSIFVLATLTFMLMKVIPGDPFMSEKAVPPEVKARLMAQYGLDKPLYQQYGQYLNNIIHGDLGVSMKMQNQDVGRVIRDSFGFSLRLGIVSIIVSVVVGVSLGMIAALNHRKLMDNFAMVVAVIGVSVPSFVLASFMQYFLGVKLRWFNVAGLNGPLDYVMPVIALSALSIAFIARLTRSSMLDVLHADYIKTAKAKGLTNWYIIRKHVIRNGILPVVTYLGPLTANVLTGSVVIESIFGIGGLGKVFVYNISNRDYPMIMGITLFYGIILMVARFLTDIAYGLVDPRIKLARRKEG